MTKQEFEIKLIEDLVKGIDTIYDYFQDNIVVLQKNKDYFREYFLNNPRSAYWYAYDVDECPTDDTRKASCKDPYYAYCYAYYVDKCPRKDTRKAECKDPYYAYRYAKYVDKCPREDTFNGVKGSKWEELYLKNIVNPH